MRASKCGITRKIPPNANKCFEPPGIALLGSTSCHCSKTQCTRTMLKKQYPVQSGKLAKWQKEGASFLPAQYLETKVQTNSEFLQKCNISLCLENRFFCFSIDLTFLAFAILLKCSRYRGFMARNLAGVVRLKNCFFRKHYLCLLRLGRVNYFFGGIKGSLKQKAYLFRRYLHANSSFNSRWQNKCYRCERLAFRIYVSFHIHHGSEQSFCTLIYPTRHLRHHFSNDTLCKMITCGFLPHFTCILKCVNLFPQSYMYMYLPNVHDIMCQGTFAKNIHSITTMPFYRLLQISVYLYR